MNHYHLIAWHPHERARQIVVEFSSMKGDLWVLQIIESCRYEAGPDHVRNCRIEAPHQSVQVGNRFQNNWVRSHHLC